MPGSSGIARLERSGFLLAGSALLRGAVPWLCTGLYASGRAFSADGAQWTTARSPRPCATCARSLLAPLLLVQGGLVLVSAHYGTRRDTAGSRTVRQPKTARNSRKKRPTPTPRVLRLPAKRARLCSCRRTQRPQFALLELRAMPPARGLLVGQQKVLEAQCSH